MKKTFLRFITTLCLIGLSASICGCFSSNPSGNGTRDYNADIVEVEIADIPLDNFIPSEDKTYYTSPGLSLMMEVNGEFLEMEYFYLDGNKRVYDNLYFYVDDYFYMISSDYKYLYASLGDTTSLEYAEEEKEMGEDIQINVKKAGIYKLIFDLDTLKFNLEYLSEIETPVYYTMKSCSIYTINKKWVEMSVNPNNSEEFVINNFSLEPGEMISFYNHVHTSNYKITLNETVKDKYAYGEGTSAWLIVGGVYNIYVNKKTYEVNLELTSEETAIYACVYYDGSEFINLQPYDSNEPYKFRQIIQVDTKYTTSVPKFYTSKYKEYTLTVLPSSNLISTEKYHYFKNIGTYEIVINLKTYELSVELLPE